MEIVAEKTVYVLAEEEYRVEALRLLKEAGIEAMVIAAEKHAEMESLKAIRLDRHLREPIPEVKKPKIEKRFPNLSRWRNGNM